MRLRVPVSRGLIFSIVLAGVTGCSEAPLEVVRSQSVGVQSGSVPSIAGAAPDTSISSKSAQTPSVQHTPEPRLRVSAPLQPVPQHIAEQICTLHRYTTEADLIARFGQARTREEDENQISMLWREDGWRLVAYWSRGELQLAGASVNHPEMVSDVIALSDYPDEFRIGQTTEYDASSLLGEGVQTAVSWHHGLDIDALAAVRNGIPMRAISDHCNHRLTYVGDNTGYVTTLAFRDGVLDGGFDDE